MLDLAGTQIWSGREPDQARRQRLDAGKRIASGVHEIRFAVQPEPIPIAMFGSRLSQRGRDRRRLSEALCLVQRITRGDVRGDEQARPKPTP